MAFFITSQNEHRTIPVSTVFSGKKAIGKTKFSEIDFANHETKSNINVNGRYCYYGEIQGTGRYAMYNYYLFATLSYGFVDEESASLGQEHSMMDSVSKEVLRKKAKPNTFGVIADGYQEIITFIPFVEE